MIQDADDEYVPSPCNGVCRFRQDLCRGCFRTLDEITSWSFLSVEEKKSVWERIRARKEERARAKSGKNLSDPSLA